MEQLLMNSTPSQTFRKKRCVGYVRVSTQEQAEEGYSIDAQIQTIQEYCQRENMECVGVYVDRGKSGKNIKGRPEMQQLLQDAESGQFDAVVVWKISRVARNLMNLLEIVNVLQKQDIAFYSISEKFQVDTTTGRFMLQIMASVNELERNQIAENVKLGMTKRAFDGGWNGGRILGYDNVENENGKKVLQVNKEEAKLIHMIFQEAATGKGYRAIANSFNRSGYKTKQGNPFSTIAVKDILYNQTYIGKIQYNKYEKWADKRRKGLSENAFVVEGQHEAIVDEALWQKVQLKLKASSKHPSWNKTGTSVLTGLIRCPECGSSMVINNVYNKLKDGTKKKIRYYSCSQFRNKGASVCHANSIQAELAESKVAENLKEVVAQPEVLERVVERMNQQLQDREKPVKRELELIKVEIEQKGSSTEKLLDLMLEAPEIATDLNKRIKQLEQEKQKLVQKERQLHRELSRDAQSVSFEEAKRTLEHLGRSIDGKQNKDLKEIYKVFIEKITFDKKSKEVTLHLVFSQDFVRKLNHATEKESSPTEGDGSFVLTQEFCLIL
ncbi:recombinase family protein [Trichococcus alkaliphilus]|uniref:recombinase family protein n=1 Tax=Trichococcus alkaliphilus TaxID=2052943 RepID=UPI0013752C13|nr:recombinase family protein [Trichococcus alkaliphilus]